MLYRRSLFPLLLQLLQLLLRLQDTIAILPTAGIQLIHNNGQIVYQLLASQASFGPSPSMTLKQPSFPLMTAPVDNPLLCDTITTTTDTPFRNAIVLVPRGDCTFQVKTLQAQRLGAVGVIVMGSLESRYSINKTTNEWIYPQDKLDYDCNNGMAMIDAKALRHIDIDMDKTTTTSHYDPANNALLSGESPTNLCWTQSTDQLMHCPSKACLLTGTKPSSSSSSSLTSKVQACCAWDLHVWLYSDPTVTTNITIPTVYVTMEQSKLLLESIGMSINVMLYSRWRSPYHISSIVIWALGVLVASFAAWSSAQDYRQSAAKQHEQQLLLASPHTHERVPSTGGGGGSPRNQSPTHHQQQQQQQRQQQQYPEEQLELSAGHALGFILMASSGLFILFYFKIYNVVKIMYAFGCSRALMQVIFEPLWSRWVSYKVFYATGTADFGDITLVDVLAFISAYSWGLIWLLFAFTVRHPEDHAFFWITQDIMGACMCIMFLSIIKLNSIRVASILLMVAFFYDIFFVFVTPLLFKGESIMITVATSGGPPKADPSWCEKYPDDNNCQGGDPLPMLLTVPRFEDYQGGASLLGLGDIVLPGLLLSFAARLDAAMELVVTARRSKHCCYFGPLVVAYAIGLMMANVAVYWMDMGQPALLYLVPCCLGTMCWLGWKRGELTGLWHGPKVLMTADTIMYGGLPTEEGLEAPMAQSSVEDEDNNDDDDNQLP